jgi:hypothetical protein
MATEIQLAVFHFFQDNGLSNTAKAMKKELGLVTSFPSSPSNPTNPNTAHMFCLPTPHTRV